MGKNFKANLGKVKAFIFDVDGVCSTSVVQLHPSGELLRTANVKDGYAIQYAVKQGYPIGIITGGKSEAVRSRFDGLGVKDIYLGSVHKVKDFEDFLNRNEVDPDSVLYMGDDLPDYPVMKQVGFPTCPADAIEEVKSISIYISDQNGGQGCVRDVIEQVLRLHGKWMLPAAFSW